MYTKDYSNVNCLLLHVNEDPQFQTNELNVLGVVGRIFISSTELQLKLLFESDQLHMNRTFCTAPPPFEQVLIIKKSVTEHVTCLIR